MGLTFNEINSKFKIFFFLQVVGTKRDSKRRKEPSFSPCVINPRSLMYTEGCIHGVKLIGVTGVSHEIPIKIYCSCFFLAVLYCLLCESFTSVTLLLVTILAINR